MNKIGKSMSHVFICISMAVFLCACMISPGLTSFTESDPAYAEESVESTADLTFSETGITEDKAGAGYTISGTTLKVTAAGVYRLSGSSSEGNIEVAKGLSDVVLVFDGLTLKSGSTAPVVIKKGSDVTIHLAEGTTSVLTDSEDPDNETSTDTTVQEAFEGACIKVKSGSSLTFCGSGSLELDASSCKNGIKGGSTASITFNEGSYTVSALNNGIACDGNLVFNGGDFDIDAENDGIKSAPDATDESEGTTVDTESLGTITINGGTFDIDVNGDGIQADTALTINDGAFNIKTMAGYNTKGTKVATYDSGVTGVTTSGTFDADTMSCKGLKASGDRAEEVGTEPALTITGGTFTLNTADDAVHSDAYVTVTGGTFDIDTGDDAMHADTTLELGTEGSTVERDPYVTVDHSYEGLEGGTIYMYQGRYYVKATDDGVNAAGGSDSSGAEQGGGFNPGGGHGPGGNPGGTPGGNSQTGSSDYNIYISGGDLYVYCNGDGLDSNGGLYLTGGTQEVFSQSSGDNSAVDADGTININGATIFTAGANPAMDPVSSSWFGNGQKYTTYSSNMSQGRILNVTLSGNVLYSTELPKSASYFMYSAPGLSGTPSIGTAASLTSCKAGSWSHSWNDGEVTTAATDESTGIRTYTCTKCGETETQTIPVTRSYACSGHVTDGAGADDEECEHLNVSDPVWTWSDDCSSAELSLKCTDCNDTIICAGEISSVLTDESTMAFTATYTLNGITYTDVKTAAPFTGTFETGEGIESIDVYYTQNYDSCDEEGASSAVARDSDTGCPVISGDGQINFKVNAKDGYTITQVSADGNYKNCKDIGDNVYRLTKITGDLTITVTAEESEEEQPETPVDTGLGEDGTAFGKGASLEVVEAAIAGLTSDADPSGSVFAPLMVKSSKQGKKTISLTWKLAKGAEKYVIYANKCGKSNKLTKLAQVSRNKTAYTVKKAAGKKLKKGTYYKFIVIALDSNDRVVSSSKIIHVATGGGKVGNYKSIKVKVKKGRTYKAVSSVSLKAGKTLKLKTVQTKASSKIKVRKHVAVRYESSDSAVATVSSKGTIKGVSSGTCKVYAYTQSGLVKVLKVTVK